LIEMRVLTEDALLLCDHGGTVEPEVRQSWVTIDRRRVLVDDDPEGRSISRCPFHNPAAAIKRCSETKEVTRGYSAFMRIDGHAVCLDTVTGFTNGTPPGVVTYSVKNPGQTLVESDA
jgi:hypothetical protein